MASSSLPTTVSTTIRRAPRSRLYTYYSTMGYIFQIVRDIDPKFRILIDTFTLVGLLYVGSIFYRFVSGSVRGFYSHVWSRLVSIDLKSRYGQWALITGPTDGVGLEYARQLAGRGLNLVLVGRSPDKLAKVREELLEKHRIEIVTIQADLNSDDPQMYQRILREAAPETREIGILVNNAGVMYDSPNRFLDQPESKIWQHVRVNMLAVVMMTRLILPSMVKRKRGLVVNISSIAAYQPLPLMGLYSASKVFVEWFSESLEIEYRNSNIDVQTLVPNYIGTKMTGFSNMLQQASLAFPNAQQFTANAIATMGRTKHSCGYWFHDLQHFFTKMTMPNWAYRSISWFFLKHIDTSGASSKRA